MDSLERRIVDTLQSDFPLCERPFAAAAGGLGIGETELIGRIGRLLERGVLTRFGPMFDAERLGGAFCLCAMRVPAADLERVAALVNTHPEVAHNYERAHRFNMWFVLATETPQRIEEVARAIEAETGLAVMRLPRDEEFYVGLRLSA